MNEESLGDLVAAVDATARGVLRAVRAFTGALRSKERADTAPAQPAAHAARFGERERLEESKYFPPALARAAGPESGQLPGAYGKTHLGLLVVDPNLVHAYWEVTPGKLQDAQEGMTEPGQAVLRFHEAGHSFDVDIDLTSRNWYVPLWSGGKSYRADLGLKSPSGGFITLAQSNPIVTPRAAPVIDRAESFMRVSANGSAAEITPAPPYRKPEPCANVPGFAAASPPGRATSSPRIDSLEILRRKLAELYAFRQWRPEPQKVEEESRVSAGSLVNERSAAEPTAEAELPDLAALAEQRQIMGLSSASLRERRREP